MRKIFLTLMVIFSIAIIRSSYSANLVEACGSSEVFLSMNFTRVQNSGGGNSEAAFFVNGTRFNSGQEVRLANDLGDFIVDGTIDSGVEGIAVQRLPGRVRIRLEGTGGTSSKEIVDAIITFRNGIIFGIVDEGLENQGDLNYDDTGNNDEVEVFPNNRGLVARLRVKNGDKDTFVINYGCLDNNRLVCGEPFITREFQSREKERVLVFEGMKVGENDSSTKIEVPLGYFCRRAELKIIGFPLNDPPVAVCEANPTSALVGRQITFNGSLSVDFDGFITSWMWKFSDGTDLSGEVVTKSFSTPGAHFGNLTVTDNEGKSDSVICNVSINAPPPPPRKSPPRGLCRSSPRRTACSPHLDVGNNGDFEWFFIGQFNDSVDIDFVEELNSILENCDCPGCTINEANNTCVIDMVVGSEFAQRFRLTDLLIECIPEREPPETEIEAPICPLGTLNFTLTSTDNCQETNTFFAVLEDNESCPEPIPKFDWGVVSEWRLDEGKGCFIKDTFDMNDGVLLTGIRLETKKNNCLTAPNSHEALVSCIERASNASGWAGISYVEAIDQEENLHGNDDFYTSEYTALFYANETGMWLFATDSDESSEIEIDGIVVAGFYGSHSACNCTDHNGAINLTKGWHKLVYKHLEIAGNQLARAFFKSPSMGEWKIFSMESGSHNPHIYGEIFGDGRDGDLDINAPDTIINAYAYVTDSNLPSGTTHINVNDASSFSAGDEILIVQMQGPGNVGTYEFGKIASISSNQIVLNEGLNNSYTSGNFNSRSANAVQIIKVPNYRTLNIVGGASITAPEWNGRTGGIAVFRAINLNIEGEINVAGKGFRGGNGCSASTGGVWDVDCRAAQGESISGLGVVSKNANNGGGGGGYGHAGGGASFVTSGTKSYGKSGNAGNILTDYEGKIILGSGGGGGSVNAGPGYGTGGKGGRGGGAIVIFAHRITGNGVLSAAGENGAAGTAHRGYDVGASGGGGGSGGTLMVVYSSIANISTSVDGGDGGKGSPCTPGTCGVNGGIGGKGFSNLTQLSSHNDLEYKNLKICTNDFWVEGKFGSSIRFGENLTKVFVPNSENLDIRREITIEAWIFPTAHNDFGRILHKEGAYSLFLHSNGRIGTSFQGFDNPGPVFSNSIIPPNTWTHVAVTWNSTSTAIYINGILDRIVPNSGTGNSSDSGIFIGNDEPFSGKIDEIRIYNLALGPEEILQLFNFESEFMQGDKGTITCSSGICEKKVCFFSRDRYGNTEEVRESEVFSITSEEAAPESFCNGSINFNAINGTCFFGCNTNLCGFENSCPLNNFCNGTIRNFNGICSENGCSFAQENCAERNFVENLTLCIGNNITRRIIFHNFTCAPEGCEENITIREELIENCDLRDGQLINQCGLADWSCSEELNQVGCVITDISPSDEFCGNFCSDDVFNFNGTCNERTFRCEFEEEFCEDSSCEETFSDFCNGSKLVDYNGNGIMDNTTVRDTEDNFCAELGCTENRAVCEAPEPDIFCSEVCGAECTSPSSFKEENGICKFSCNLDSCSFLEEQNMSNFCLENVRFFNATCTPNGVKFEQENCGDMNFNESSLICLNGAVVNRTTVHEFTCSPEGCEENIRVIDNVVEDCSAKNGTTRNECGIEIWSCSQNNEAAQCILDEIIPEDDLCIEGEVCNETFTCVEIFGCIEILKEALDPSNDPVTPVPQFTFLLDNNTTATNNAEGIARFENVVPGLHNVSEIVPEGWELISVTPENGSVAVSPGDSCVGVLFKNRQLISERFCDGDLIKERVGPEVRVIENCNERDFNETLGNICSGDNVINRIIFHDFTCAEREEAVKCEEVSTSIFDDFVQNCNTLDGNYCTSDMENVEVRDYFCSSGICTFNITEPEICEGEGSWTGGGNIPGFDDPACIFTIKTPFCNGTQGIKGAECSFTENISFVKDFDNLDQKNICIGKKSAGRDFYCDLSTCNSTNPELGCGFAFEDIDGMCSFECNAECVSPSQFSSVNNTCLFNCNLETCEFDNSVSLDNFCQNDVRHFNGICTPNGVKFEQENCNEKDFYEVVRFCSGEFVKEKTLFHDFSCSPEGCIETVSIVNISEIESCNERDGIVNECGIEDWTCSSNGTTAFCSLKEIRKEPNLCNGDKCDGDIALVNATCNDSFACEFDTLDCNIFDGNYCSNESALEQRDYTCLAGACIFSVIDREICPGGEWINGGNAPGFDDPACIFSRGICAGTEGNASCTVNESFIADFDNLDQENICIGKKEGSRDFYCDLSTCNNTNPELGCSAGVEEIVGACSLTCNAECETDLDCEPRLEDNFCLFNGACTNSCSCELRNSEFCPEPGTVIDGLCYFGIRTCTNSGCEIQTCELSSDGVCNPELGCLVCEAGEEIVNTFNSFEEVGMEFKAGGGFNITAGIEVPLNTKIFSAEANVSGSPAKVNVTRMIDSAFVLDVSGSMKGVKLASVKNASIRFVELVKSINHESSIGLVTYSTDVVKSIPLTSDKDFIIGEINSMTAGGTTCISCGIQEGINIMQGSTQPSVGIIVMTDGKANRCISGLCTLNRAKEEAIEKAKEAWEIYGIRVFAIAFGEDADREVMRRIAEVGNGTFSVADTNNIKDVFENLAVISVDSFPENVSIDFSGNGIEEFSKQGVLNSSFRFSFTEELKELLDLCSCPLCEIKNDSCVMKFNSSSQTAGIVKLSNLSILACNFVPESGSEKQGGERQGQRDNGTTSQKTFELHLNKGWNFISTPLMNNSNIEEVLYEADGKYGLIMKYQNGEWKIYTPADLNRSDFRKLEPGVGYWIFARENLSVGIEGEEKELQLNLSKGWNAIGFTYTSNVDIVEALFEISGKYAVIMTYKDGDWLVYNPEIPEFSTLEFVEPGRGYWIYMKENGILNSGD